MIASKKKQKRKPELQSEESNKVKVLGSVMSLPNLKMEWFHLHQSLYKESIILNQMLCMTKVVSCNF